MCYYVLNDKGSVLTRTTVQRVPEVDMRSDEMKERLKSFDDHITELLSDENYIVHGPEGDNVIYLPDIDDAITDAPYQDPEKKSKSPPDFEEYTPDAYDQYIGAQILLLTGDGRISGRVTKQQKDDAGNPIGRRHANPLLDTRAYEIDLSDGQVLEMTANGIAENIYPQYDSEGLGVL